jgi:hypothetical protein
MAHACVQGTMFWEWQFEDWGNDEFEYNRPYGVVEGSPTWDSTIRPFSSTLAEHAINNMLNMPVSNCGPA